MYVRSRLRGFACACRISTSTSTSNSKKTAHYPNKKAPLPNMGNLPQGWARMKYEKQRKRSVQNGDVPIIFFYPAITGTDVFIAQETWDEIKATCNYGLSSL